MKIHIHAIGERLPVWVQAGIDDYEKRFRTFADFSLIVKSLAAAKRHQTDSGKMIAQESQTLLDSLPNQCVVVALDVTGKRYTSEALAQELADLNIRALPLVILIGGPDGFDQRVRARADLCWSLSDLTLPHPLVRLLLVETLYRSISILKNHPYHRG